MLRKASALLTAAVLLLGGSAGPGKAQEPIPHPPAMVSSQPGQGLDGGPGPMLGPAPSDPFDDDNGPLLKGDPLLDPPNLPPPGWFVAFETGILHPVYRNRLTGTVPIIGLPNQPVFVPTASLDWTGSPRAEIGYRFSEGFGEILVSYRSVVAEGAGVIPNYDIVGAGSLLSRLNVNVIDLDYAAREFALGDLWDMRWKIGARLSSNYFDTQSLGVALGQRASNHFFGSGPHAGLELQRRFGASGLALLGRIDGAVQIGRVSQDFEQVIFGVPAMGGAVSQEATQYVPILRMQAGLSWTPPMRKRFFCFSAGYEFEEWWGVGRMPGGAATSTANFFMNGAFVRGEWSY